MEETIRELIKKLEVERGVPVEFMLKALGSPDPEVFGDLRDRQYTVRGLKESGVEFDIGRILAGQYQSFGSLSAAVERIKCAYLPPHNTDMNAPMNIEGIEPRAQGIYALVNGTYKDGALTPHPGFESRAEPYYIKIADVSVSFLE